MRTAVPKVWRTASRIYETSQNSPFFLHDANERNYHLRTEIVYSPAVNPNAPFMKSATVIEHLQGFTAAKPLHAFKLLTDNDRPIIPVT